MRTRRRGLSVQARVQASYAIALRLTTSRLFQNSERIALYYANDGEVETFAVMRRAWARHKHCYLPKLYRVGARRLWFAPVHEGAKLSANRFGIPEPEVSPRHWKKAGAMDLIVVPLVAFDPRGNRIGMGGGFYDQTLAFLHRRRTWRRPHLVGVAYEFQKVATLQSCPWDVPLDAVVTEERVYRPGDRRP
jgi:5-formyltetrahydrofolate cyclo-ligase